MTMKRVAVSVKLCTAAICAVAVCFFALTWYELPGATELAHMSERVWLVVRSNGEAQTDLVEVRAPFPVKPSDLPDHLKRLLIFQEDRRFRSHLGIDPKGLARGLWSGLRGRRFQGGSTLSQQCAKNLFFGSERTFVRKGREFVLATKLEWALTKDEILVLYLNNVPFGPNTYGIEAAARRYFSKRTRDLNLFEAAVLISSLPAPGRYGWEGDKAEATRRAQRLLQSACDVGILSDCLVKRSLGLGAEPGNRPLKAPELRWLYYHLRPEIATRLVNRRGVFVALTTLNAENQVYAEDAVAQQLDPLTRQAAKADQAGLITLNLEGEILALVGGRDFAVGQLNHATDTRRQCGSVFKLFVFLAALDRGYRPEYTVMDKADGNGWPRNYDGRYRGLVKLTEAFVESRNAATVNLMHEVGIGEVERVARNLGVPLPQRPTRALALGTSELTLLEATEAYTAVANGGWAVNAYGLVGLRDGCGHMLYRRPDNVPRRVLRASIASDANLLLRKVVTQGTGHRAGVSNVKCAGKTGTTNNARDAWFIGYTPNLCTGVWVGNENGAPMSNVTGGGVPANLWRTYVASTYAFQDVLELCQCIP